MFLLLRGQRGPDGIEFGQHTAEVLGVDVICVESRSLKRKFRQSPLCRLDLALDTGCITRERMSQIMELIWLAPDIQQEILEFPPNTSGRFPISEVAVRRVAGSLGWAEQRELWRCMKQQSYLE